MRSKRMKRIALILAVTLAVQSAMGLKMFDMTVKADSSVSREEPAGENETTTGEISTEEESTGDGEGEELPRRRLPQRSRPRKNLRPRNRLQRNLPRNSLRHSRQFRETIVLSMAFIR